MTWLSAVVAAVGHYCLDLLVSRDWN
jgi:hypothetical protein